MGRISNMPLGPKLVLLFLSLSLLPLAGVTWLTRAAAVDGAEQISQSSSEAIRGQVFAQLASVREGRKSSIEREFAKYEKQILTFSNDLMVVEAARAFEGAVDTYAGELGLQPSDTPRLRSELGNYYSSQFGAVYAEENGATPRATLGSIDPTAVAMQHAYILRNSNPLGSKHVLDASSDGTTYDQHHRRFHPVIRQYLEEFGYYDIFICDPETGRIVYSVFKELDYGTSLLNGPYADSGIAEAFRAVADSRDANQTYLTDFASYFPSYEAPASFISSPIMDGGEVVGVAIFQMPLDGISDVMGGREGLGETGEALIVGADFLPRSNSFRSESHGVIAAFRDPANGAVDHDVVRRALAGEEGLQVVESYDGTEVLSAFAPVDILGMRWAIVAEQATSEALTSLTEIEAISAATTGAMMSRSYWTWGIACVIVLVVSLVVSRDISRRLARIGDTLAIRAATTKSTASTLRSTSRELSDSADTEAASLEEVSASLEQMDSLTTMNASNTDRAR